MRTSSTRKVLALAVAAATCAGGAAYAGPVGSGAGTGIVDWFAIYQDVGNGHSARSYCEYAVNPGPTGHFEAGANAMTGGSLSPSYDAAKVQISCTFYGTSTGTLVLSDSTTNSSTATAPSVDQAVGRPTKICMTARVEWDNGDVFSVVNRCRTRRIDWWRTEVALSVGLDDRTEAIVDGGTGTGIGCTEAASGIASGSCAGRATAYAKETAATAGGDYQPGVVVEIGTGPGAR
jgi:hypothetical protein